MYPWISHTFDFWLQFCEKSAAHTWMFTVILFSWSQSPYPQDFNVRFSRGIVKVNEKLVLKFCISALIFRKSLDSALCCLAGIRHTRTV